MINAPRGTQRLGAVLLLAATIGATGVGLAWPLTLYLMTNEARIEERERQVDRLSQQAATIGPTEAQLARAISRRDVHTGLMRETSLALAAAALQDRLKAAVEAVDGELESTQVLPTGERGPFRSLTLNARWSVDTAGLRDLLYTLETSSPRLQIEKLTVTGAGRATRDRLDVRARLTALLETERETL